MTPKIPNFPCRGNLPPILSALFALVLFAAAAGGARAASLQVQITGVINGVGEVELASGVAVADAQGNINGEASLDANKTYQLILYGSCSEAAVILLPPSGYKIYIDGVETKRIQVQNVDYTVPSVHDVSIWQSGSGTAPGAAASPGLSSGDFTWGASLGRAYNGASAGSLAITRASLAPSGFNRGVLQCHGVTGQTGVIRDAAGHIRQIVAPEALVDIVDVPATATAGPGFRIDFYPISALVQSISPPYPIAVGAVPFVSYEIRPPQTPGGPLEITDPVKLTSVTGGSTLTVGVGLGDEVVEEIHEETQTTNAHGDKIRVETVTLLSGALGAGANAGNSSHVAMKTRKTYQANRVAPYPDYYDPERLVEEVRNPGAVGGRALTTTYEYYELNPPSLGLPGRLKKETKPDGSWIMYEYYTASDGFNNPSPKIGALRRETHGDAPWQNGFSFRVIEYDYVPDWDGAYTLLSFREESIGGSVTTFKRTGAAQLDQEANGLKYYIYTETLHGSLGPAGETLVTTTKRYQPARGDSATLAARAVFNNLPYSIEQPDGAKVSHAYQRGNIAASSGVFTACAGFTQAATAMREITLAGLGHSVAGAVAFSNLNTITLGGVAIGNVTIDTIHLVPNRSVAKVAIRNNGRVIREECHVFTGGADFEMLSWTNYTYTASGQLASRTGSTGAEYTATWENGFRTSAVTETGEIYEYSPDLFNRVKSVQRAGVSASGTHAA